MGFKGMLRPRKDGGYSMCTACENMVGKRRCVHTLEKPAFNVRYVNGTSFVNLSGKVEGQTTEMKFVANESDMKEYIKSLSDGLNDSDRTEVLRALGEVTNYKEKKKTIISGFKSSSIRAMEEDLDEYWQ